MKSKHIKILLIIVFCCQPTYNHADVSKTLVEETDKLIELQKKDNKQDSDKKGSWLPVPIPLANPTLGTGLVGALLYLHPKKSMDPTAPSATSGLGILYTDTDSWFAGLFHDDYWLNDRIRFKVLAGTGDFNLEYYGIGDEPIFQDQPVSYSIKAKGTKLQILIRWPDDSDWYFGPSHTYTSGEVLFKLDSLEESLPDVGGTLTTSSLGMVASYDDRDDNYYPTSGQYLEAIYARDDSAWGSDFSYNKFSGFYNHYFSLSRTGTLATRIHLSTLSGDAPFYMLPTLNMRGFPRGRYRDDAALSGHIEWRHKFQPRWAYVAFTEIGVTGDSLSDALDTKPITSIGGGLRWQVLENKSLNLGVDVGFSKGERALYIQVGERF
jgi:hypothetical protein